MPGNDGCLLAFIFVEPPFLLLLREFGEYVFWETCHPLIDNHRMP
jgi:hypothetical protein